MSDTNPPLPGAADAPHLTPTPHAVVRPVFEAEALEEDETPDVADELAAACGGMLRRIVGEEPYLALISDQPTFDAVNAIRAALARYRAAKNGER